MLLGELARLTQAAARRHGEHGFARHRDDAQRVASRLSMPAQSYEKDRVLTDDLDRLRFGRTTIKQGTRGHRGWIRGKSVGR
jgi:hypothetical protein